MLARVSCVFGGGIEFFIIAVMIVCGIFFRGERR